MRQRSLFLYWPVLFCRVPRQPHRWRIVLTTNEFGNWVASPDAKTLYFPRQRKPLLSHRPGAGMLRRSNGGMRA